MNQNSVFVRWHYVTERPDRQVVLPDGSRDILFLTDPDGHTRILTTHLDFRPRVVLLTAHTQITGYRLRPGLPVTQTAIDTAMTMTKERVAAVDLVSLEELLLNEHSKPTEIDEAITALTMHASILNAARALGVSMRTLQRLFTRHHLPSPQYWHLLARARRASRTLSTAPSLVEAAVLLGYSDQAHMTRDIVRWFGKPPARLMQDPELLEALLQPALGNWTGEQISTR